MAVVYAEYNDQGTRAHSAKGYGESRGYGVYRHRPRSRRGHRIIRPGSSWDHSEDYTKTTEGRTDRSSVFLYVSYKTCIFEFGKCLPLWTYLRWNFA